MSIDIFMRELREKRNMTQQQFAELLGVSVPTVSRIEVGMQTTLSPRMASKIASILSSEEASRLNSSDAQEHKVADYYSREGHSISSMEEDWASEILSKLNDMVGAIGFKLIKERGCTNVYYCNPENGKTWQVRQYRADVTDKGATIVSFLAARIGQAFLIEKSLPNKISILTQNTADEVKEKIGEYMPRYLPFDLSFLHYSDDGLIYSETDLVLNTDGHGIFDLESEDAAAKANAAMDFAKWKTSFFKTD